MWYLHALQCQHFKLKALRGARYLESMAGQAADCSTELGTGPFVEAALGAQKTHHSKITNELQGYVGGHKVELLY